MLGAPLKFFPFFRCWAMSKYVWLSVVAWSCIGGWGLAQEFCLFNKVFVGQETVASTTIFRAGRVYDVLDTPSEVIIFDPPRNRFVILDSTRKVKTELTTDQVDAFCQRIRAEALTTNDPLAQFLAAPNFDESYDDSTGELTLSNPWLTYKVKTVAPQSPEMARQYFAYVQWQTKLNTALRAGSLPPFARVALNTALENRGRIPIEVHVTRQNPQVSRKPITLRSEHRIQTRILASDASKVDEADRHLATFAALSLIEFQRRELSTSQAPSKSPAGVK